MDHSNGWQVLAEENDNGTGKEEGEKKNQWSFCEGLQNAGRAGVIDDRHPYYLG